MSAGFKFHFHGTRLELSQTALFFGQAGGEGICRYIVTGALESPSERGEIFAFIRHRLTHGGLQWKLETTSKFLAA